MLFASRCGAGGCDSARPRVLTARAVCHRRRRPGRPLSDSRLQPRRTRLMVGLGVSLGLLGLRRLRGRSARADWGETRQLPANARLAPPAAAFSRSAPIPPHCRFVRRAPAAAAGGAPDSGRRVRGRAAGGVHWHAGHALDPHALQRQHHGGAARAAGWRPARAAAASAAGSCAWRRSLRYAAHWQTKDSADPVPPPSYNNRTTESSWGPKFPW